MISTVVLTHNDEKILDRTLTSLTWCDQIIVIDDFSTDATITVAKKFGAKIFKRHLNDNFAEQRNFGLSKTKGDWVLFVDSDEVVTKELAYEIQEKINHQARNENIVGYFLKRKDFFLGKWLSYGETSQVKLLRLAKKSSGKWARSVHETWNIEGETETLTRPLHHYPHQNVAQFIDEINRYSSLNARYFFDQGIKTSGWQIIFYPSAKFLLNYLWYGGLMDGMPGLILVIGMSFHSFLTRAKLYLLWHGQKKSK